MSTFTLFRCNKLPVNLISHLKNTFIKTESDEQTNSQSYKIDIYTYNNQGITEDIDALFGLIRSRWYCIQEIVLNDSSTALADILSSREFINEAFTMIIKSVLSVHDSTQKKIIQEQLLRVLNKFSSAVVQTVKLSGNILLKIKLSKQETCPFYQYTHSLLEMYCYIMLLYFICGPQTIENYLENIMRNLLYVFKIDIKELHKSDMCSCTTYFWLSIQLITERSADNLFWRVFNKVMEKEDPIISLNALRDLSNIQKFNDNFENMGSKCERIKPNYHFLELKFKEYLSEADCDSLIISFKLIEPLICDLWLKEGKIDTLQIIWEFYSKRLNVSSQHCSNIGALNVIETLDTILFCPKDCTEDFEFFVGLLLHHLREYPMHWGKIKGRIYSQLGPNKVKDLTDIGIRHVMILFLALSSIHFEEVEKKILAFMDNLPKEKKYTNVVWNMYAALILKYVRESHSIERIAPPMAHMLEEAAANQKQFHLIEDFIKNFEYIINNSTSMQLHQWLLMGSWLGRYQSVCRFVYLNHSLDVIVLLLEKCSNVDSWFLWESFFKDVIFVNLKELAIHSNAPAILGKIAGKLALCCNDLANDAFCFFNNDLISPKIASVFLEVIMDSYPDSLIMITQQENSILQSWVKICFLTVEPQCGLSRNVLKLDIFPSMLKNNLKTASEPMEIFIQYLGNNSKQLAVQSIRDVVKLCDLAFGNLDKTLAQYLLNPDNEQIVIKCYKYASLLCLSCGHLIYNRNKPVSILTKLVQVLLLPMDFLMGKKTLHNFVLNAVKSFWPTFFNAFINLNNIKDAYLERTLKDMVVKYMPYFPTSSSPIVNCLENPQMAEVILEKINLSYFKPPVKESDATLSKALKIVSDLANSTTSIPIFKLLINKTLYGLFEVVIFHAQRSSAIAAIKHITNSPLFVHVKPEFKHTILSVTEKYMPLNTTNYFQLMMCLAKFAPGDIRDVLSEIAIHVGNVERLRGVGFDKTLRLHLERLENSLQSSS